MQHYFDIEIAQEYGIEAAILLNHIHFWVIKNEANEKHFYDGYYWTYNSHAAFSKLFPYMNQRQIKYQLSQLQEKGLILTGNYNKNAFDRTTWYTLTQKARDLLEPRNRMRQKVPQTQETPIVQNCPLGEINEKVQDVNTEGTLYTERAASPVFTESTKLSHRRNINVPSAVQNCPSNTRYKHRLKNTDIKSSSSGGSTGVKNANGKNAEEEDLETTKMTNVFAEKIKADELKSTWCAEWHEVIDRICLILAEAFSSKKKTVRIGGTSKPTVIVQKELNKITKEHAESVLNSLANNTGDIYNLDQYLLTLLYNAIITQPLNLIRELNMTDPKPTNAFQNFEQHDIDFNDLERRIAQYNTRNYGDG